MKIEGLTTKQCSEFLDILRATRVDYSCITTMRIKRNGLFKKDEWIYDVDVTINEKANFDKYTNTAYNLMLKRIEEEQRSEEERWNLYRRFWDKVLEKPTLHKWSVTFHNGKSVTVEAEKWYADKRWIAFTTANVTKAIYAESNVASVVLLENKAKK